MRRGLSEHVRLVKLAARSHQNFLRATCRPKRILAMPFEFSLAFVTSGDDLENVRGLFREYALEWNLNLCFQNFEEELASLPGCYAPPGGRLMIARHCNELAGCVAVREFTTGVAEMKRLYVRPRFRGQGLGRILARSAVSTAREIGYELMRLDTLERMKSAVELYQTLGFERIAAYRANPEADVVYMELRLQTDSEQDG